MQWRVEVNYGKGLPTDEKVFAMRHPVDVMRAVAADWVNAQQGGGISMGDTAAYALEHGYAPTITITMQAEAAQAVPHD